MGARSAAASVVRHAGGVAAEAFLVAALVATVALAFSPVYAPAKFVSDTGSAFAASAKITMSIAGTAASAPTVAGGSVSFAVSRTAAFDEVLWVTNTCYDVTGALVGRSDLPVVWGLSYSLVGSAGTFLVSGSSCVAYATWRPWTNKLIQGTVIAFAVSN